MTDKVNWVVAGIGDIARKRVIPAIQAEPRSRLYGFVTRDSAKAKAYAGTRALATIEEAAADPAVDAVYIALPVALHAETHHRRAARGQACAVREAHGDELRAGASHGAEAARSTGRLLGVSYYRRLYPKLVRARQLIAEGAIGQPLLAEANCHGWLEIWMAANGCAIRRWPAAVRFTTSPRIVSTP